MKKAKIKSNVPSHLNNWTFGEKKRVRKEALEELKVAKKLDQGKVPVRIDSKTVVYKRVI